MKKNNIKLLALAILSVLFIACDTSFLDPIIDGGDDSFNADWSRKVKIPAGNLTYTVSELFDELGASDFGANATEELKFSHSQSFSSAGQDNSAFNVDVPNTTISSTVNTPITAGDIAPEVFPFTIPGAVPAELTGKSESNQTVYDLGLTQELTSASLNGGTMTITFNSTFDANVTLSLNIPSFTYKADGTDHSKNDSYSESVVISGAGVQVFNVNLNEFNADFTHDGTDFVSGTINNVVLNLNAEFEFYTGSVINSTDKITYDAVLTGASTDVVYGDFKQEAFSVSNQSIDLDFFDNFGDADIDFSNVSMTISATNDFGFPIGLDLSGVQGTGSGTTDLTYFGEGVTNNTLIIDGVANFGDAEKLTSVTLTASNSNIDVLLKAKPSSIDLNVSGTANPESATGNSNFYATTNTGLNVDLTISFDNVSLNKSIEFDNGGDLEDINEMVLTVAVENKIPLTGNIVMLFKNNSDETVHTETIQAFNAANVNGAGESDGVAVESNFEISLNESEISVVSDATKIDVMLTLELPSGEDTVQLKGTDEIKLYIGALVDLEISSDDN